MKRHKGDGLDVEKFFEYARQRETRASLKPLNFTFEPARRPDLMMPERPRADIRAADTAMRDIREYASKARELYRERRHNERPMEAREYVRHQLALGMLDAPGRRPTKNEMALGRAADRTPRELREERKEERPRPLFGLWRRRTTRD